jgi:hypothetical protein
MAVPAHDGKRSGVALLRDAGQANHVDGIPCQADFFAQSSVLSTHDLSIDPEPLNLKPAARFYLNILAACSMSSGQKTNKHLSSGEETDP